MKLTSIAPKSKRPRPGWVRAGDLVRIEWATGVAWARVAATLERISGPDGPELGVVIGKTTLGRWMLARVGSGEDVSVTDHRPEMDEAVRASIVETLAREVKSVRWPEGTGLQRIT